MFLLLIIFVFIFNAFSKDVPYGNEQALDKEFQSNVRHQEKGLQKKYQPKIKKRILGRKVEKAGIGIADAAKSMKKGKDLADSLEDSEDSMLSSIGGSIGLLIKSLSYAGQGIGHVVQAIGRRIHRSVHLENIDEQFLEAIVLKEEKVKLLTKKLQTLIKPMTLGRVFNDPKLTPAERVLSMFKPDTFKKTFKGWTDDLHLTHDKEERWIDIMSVQKLLQSENEDLLEYKRLLLIKLKEARIREIKDLLDVDQAIKRLEVKKTKMDSDLKGSKKLGEKDNPFWKKMEEEKVKIDEMMNSLKVNRDILSKNQNKKQALQLELADLEKSVKQDISLSNLSKNNAENLVKDMRYKILPLVFQRLKRIEDKLGISWTPTPQDTKGLDPSIAKAADPQALKKDMDSGKEKWEGLRAEQDQLLQAQKELQASKKRHEKSPLRFIKRKEYKQKQVKDDANILDNETRLNANKDNLKNLEKKLAQLSGQYRDGLKAPKKPTDDKKTSSAPQPGGSANTAPQRPLPNPPISSVVKKDQVTTPPLSTDDKN